MPDVTRKVRKPHSQIEPASASSDFARDINRDVILELVRCQQPVSRVQLARASGLQNSTVSSIIEQLLKESWVTEGEALRTARGRRPTQISLNANLAILTADVHLGRAMIAAVDLNGLLLESLEIPLALTVKKAVDDLAQALVVLRARYPDRLFIGAGVCLPGRVDRAAGKLILAPNLNWPDYPIQQVLTQHLDIPVELENDANACLLAELWFGNLSAIQDAVLLAISEGVGASILADGNLVGGRLGMAGEIGHICVDPAGPQCACGRHGCWEIFASSRAALRHYGQPGVTDYRHLIDLAQTGDARALAAIHHQAQAIGRGLRIITAALDPQLILFAGEISLAWPLILPILTQACQAGMLAGEPPRLACTGVVDVAHLRGAAAVVLQRHATYYRSRSNTHAIASSIEVASSELTREVNRDTVLERLRLLQPISRVDLARACGLQPSTVSAIVEQLLNQRWVREGALIKTARGRRPTLLSLNDDLVFLVADIRPARAVVALVDLSGRLLERQLLPFATDPERSLSAIADVMQRLRDLHPQRTFEGAGLSMPGRVDPATNQVLVTPNLRWPAFPIRDYLAQRLNLTVQLENAANAALLSELWFGRVDARDCLLVTVSEGIGVAILAGNHLVHGRQGIAGEFGHISLDPAGQLCSCGARGCWEQYASSRAALRYHAALSPTQPAATPTDLLSLALDGDPHALAAVHQQAHALGRGLHLLNALLAPALILLSGDLTAAWHLYGPILERACRTGAMDGIGPTLRPTGDSELTRLRGAAAVVLQRHAGYYRATHKRIEPR